MTASRSSKLAKGEVVADFALPDVSGATVSLAEMLREGPIVLVLIRSLI